MKINLTKIKVEGVRIELSSEDVMGLITELEKLKDLLLINHNDNPFLWKTSILLKEKVIFDIQKLETK